MIDRLPRMEGRGPALDPAPSNPAAAAYAALRAQDRREGGLPVERRLLLLARLEAGLIAAQDEIVAAIATDFGRRAAEETLLGEVLGTVRAIRHARRHLHGWARPRRVATGLPFWPARARIVPQPLGVVGIVAPWNYPLLLALSPLVSALAAGNRIAVKPSELAPRTAALTARLVEAALGSETARVVEGGPEIAAAFVRQPFDHLLFTGSTQRGREAALAAAANLTPVTLELGGKCWALVTPDADLGRAAQAIVAGKGLNAGQTCVAPDSVLLAGVDRERFVALLRDACRRLYPGGLPTAVIGHAAARVQRLAAVAGDQDGPLHLVLDPEPGSLLAEEEMFAPVLPVIALPDLGAALEWMRARPQPLAIYLFGRDRGIEQAVMDATRAGALVTGGTVIQAAIDALPFGGVGASGSGRYHGRAGFDTFSNLRAHVRVARFSLSRLGDPPYSRFIRRLARRLLGASRRRPPDC